MPDGTETQPKPARTRAPKADVIDQLTEALNAPAEDPKRQKLDAFLETVLADRAPAAVVSDRPRNIIEALVAVMRMVSHLGKDSRSDQGGFNFRGIDATVNALGPAMREIGVVPQPEVLSYEYGEVEVGQRRTKQAHTQVRVRYHFHYSNADGELSSIAAEVPGEAMDSGDKATAKAMSVAMRIALLQTFALPTTEPDPDNEVYVRSDAPVRTATDVYNAVQWAKNEDDLDIAFKTVREQFGDELRSITCKNRAGEEVNGEDYLTLAQEQIAEFRARKAAEEQDAAAQGPTSDVSEHAQQDARTEEPAQDARAPQDAQPAPEPARTPPPAQEETRTERQLRLAREELIWQADVLAVNPVEYAASVLPEPDVASLLFNPTTVRFLVGQRAQVIPVLREAGRATEAANLERLDQAFPIMVSELGNEDSAREQEPQPAQ